MTEISKGAGEVKTGVLPAILLCILSAYAITAVLLLLLAFLLYRFELGIGSVTAGVILIYLTATFCAGFLVGKKIGNRRFLWGALTGTGYFTILAICSLMTEPSVVGTGLITSLFLCVGGGMLGGMFS